MQSLKAASFHSPAPATLHHPKYRPDIDGLRAIAVLAVVVFHAFPEWLKGGFIGVDVFFVISGFLITSILVGGLRFDTFSFWDFYARRANRIFPALIIVLGTSFVFGWHTLLASEFSQLGKHIAAGSGFLSNLVLLSEVGYFDTVAETKPLLHLWSLGVEEQFYLLWPLILWASYKLNKRLLGVMLIVFVASLSANLWFVSDQKMLAFFSPLTRFWEMTAGGMLALLSLRSNAQPQSRAVTNLLSISGVTLIALGLAYIDKEQAFPGALACIPVAGAMLLIGAGPQAFINRLLSLRVMVWVGLISYPLYLWHWPLLSFARLIEGGEPALHVRLMLVATSIALAAATYNLVEKPLRHITHTHKTAALVTILAAIGIAGLVAWKQDGISSREVIRATANINSQFTGGVWQFSQNERCTRRYHFEEASSYRWWFCMTNRDADPTVMIVGSSFANHLYPGIAKNLSRETVLNIGSCEISRAYSGATTDPETNYPCDGTRPHRQLEFVKQIISSSKGLKMVIISGLLSKSTPEYIAAVDDFITYIENQGIRAVIFYPHVKHDYDIRSCFARPLKAPTNTCRITAEEANAQLKQFEQLRTSISAKHPQALFYNHNATYCDTSGCSTVINQMPMFRDQYAHFSEYASDLIARDFIRWANEKKLGLGKPQ